MYLVNYLFSKRKKRKDKEFLKVPHNYKKYNKIGLTKMQRCSKVKT